MRKYFPHYTTDVLDAGLNIIEEIITQPLFRPVFAMKTERGRIGVPVFCPALAFAKTEFGEETFNKNNTEYFSRASVFASAILENCGCWIIRLGGQTENALEKAHMLIEAVVDTENKTWTWNSRQLESDETVDGLLAAQQSAEATPTVGTTYTLPFMLLEARDPGKYGNQYGFNLSVDDDSLDFSELEKIKNVMYKLGFIYRANTSTTVNNVLTMYNTDSFTFGLDDTQIDPDTLSTFGLDVQMSRYWKSNYPSPIVPTVFSANVSFLLNILKVVCAAELVSDPTNVILETIQGILENRKYSVDLFHLTTTWFDDTGDASEWGEESIDVASSLGITLTDNTISSDPVNGGLHSSINIMLTGGTDGYLDIGGADLDDSSAASAIHNDIIRLWNMETNPELQDGVRYPFNMIIDTGYPVNVKAAIIDTLSVRKDVKPILSAWNGTSQTEAQRVQVASTLINMLRSYPESLLYRTQTFQACVFHQTGFLANSEFYRKRVPLTFWYVDKLARMHNRTFIKEHPEGTKAQITSMVDIDYVPYTDVIKQVLWSTGVNYAQYRNNTGLHVATLRSCYEHESSPFTDDSFVNTTLYVKQVLPEVWANHSGRTDPIDVLKADVLNELNGKLNHLLGGKIPFQVDFYQTASEKVAGFEHHISVTLYSTLGARIFHYDIIGRRA